VISDRLRQVQRVEGSRSAMASHFVQLLLMAVLVSVAKASAEETHSKISRKEQSQALASSPSSGQEQSSSNVTMPKTKLLRGSHAAAENVNVSETWAPSNLTVEPVRSANDESNLTDRSGGFKTATWTFNNLYSNVWVGDIVAKTGEFYKRFCANPTLTGGGWCMRWEWKYVPGIEFRAGLSAPSCDYGYLDGWFSFEWNSNNGGNVVRTWSMHSGSEGWSGTKDWFIGGYWSSPNGYMTVSANTRCRWF